MTQASEFYAGSEGAACCGGQQCHYCTAPCTRLWRHREPPPVPFARSTTTAKKPESPWMCQACWLWQRKRVTVHWLSGGFKDCLCAMDHSWLIREGCARAVRSECREELYKILLAPPLKFSLSLLEGDKPPPNLLQLHLLNDNAEVKADTELHYTINNIPHAYTVYELEETLLHGEDGRMPGARALLRVLGPMPGMVREEDKEKLRKGRPTVEERMNRVDPREGKQERVVTGDKDSRGEKGDRKKAG